MFSWFVSFYIYILNLKLKKVTTSLTGGIKKPFSEVALQTRESLKRPYFPLPLSILAGTNLITLILFFFATPVWFPRKSIPHSILGKIHPRLISEKIHAKPSRKTKRNYFFFAPCVFSPPPFDFRENPCKTPKENQKNYFFLLPVFSRRHYSIFGKINPRLISEKIQAKPPRKTKKFAFFCSLCFMDLF